MGDGLTGRGTDTVLYSNHGMEIHVGWRGKLRIERRASTNGSDSALFRPLPVVLLGLIIVVGMSRLSVEAPFFGRSALVNSAGWASVPQDDRNDPEVDLALRRAAHALPTGAVCVIGRDSWNRDYFRASYLLMPRRVWPVAPLLSVPEPSIGTLAAALSSHHADCLLISPGAAVPDGWLRVSDGTYATFIPKGRR
jgi:hypothetical protein